MEKTENKSSMFKIEDIIDIAREAGCMITDIDGNPLSFKGATSVICRARGIKEIPECFW